MIHVNGYSSGVGGVGGMDNLIKVTAIVDTDEDGPINTYNKVTGNAV
jgi:hypothetical protein